MRVNEVAFARDVARREAEAAQRARVGRRQAWRDVARCLVYGLAAFGVVSYLGYLVSCMGGGS